MCLTRLIFKHVGKAVPDVEVFGNGFRVQWEMFLSHVVEDAPWKYDLMAGARGVQLAELGMQSWAERRWLDVQDLEVEMLTINYPKEGMVWNPIELGNPIDYQAPQVSLNRVAFAAVHVVSDPTEFC